MLGDQHQCLDRGKPCRCIVAALPQLRDVVAGITQVAQLATAMQRDGIVEGAVRALARCCSYLATPELHGLAFVSKL